MELHDAILLFQRLGVDVLSLSGKEFSSAYAMLAKRYHPDVGNQQTHDLMANINAARSTIRKVFRPGEFGRR